MNRIQREAALVYVVECKYRTRRFFTKRAAISCLAWDMIRRKQRLQYDPEEDFDFKYKDHLGELHDRYTRFISQYL